MGWFRIQLDTQEEIPGAFGILFNVFVLALFFDAAATSIFMIHYGTDFEIHPVYVSASVALGPVYGPILGALCKTCGGIVIAKFNRRFCCYVLLLTILISLTAGMVNLCSCPIFTNSFVLALPF